MTKQPETNIDQLSFEAALEALAETVGRLEAGDMALSDSLRLYEHGQKLAAHCSQQLEAASLKVEQLSADGEIVDIS